MPSLKYQLFFSQGLLRHQTVFGQQLVRIIFRDQTLLFLSTAVPHACQTGSLTKAKQALRAGSALLASRPSTSVAAGSCHLTAAQTLSQGPTAREGAAHLLVSTLPISSSLLLLVPPASHHQRTSHLSSKKSTVYNLLVLWNFSYSDNRKPFNGGLSRERCRHQTLKWT